MEKFVVSARKYRPQTFDTVVGQEHITTTLRNAIRNQQLAHAFLFCGPRGVGKTTCARILAKTINCEHQTPDGEACNQCTSCVSFNNGTSMNIHELDAASNNSVDDIRSLVDQVRFAPQAGQYKVYIIDEVHMLSSAAFNAFLKTLEEPPPYAIFILATTEKHKILPTILSRCQIFDFKRITLQDTVDHLEGIAKKEQIKTQDTALQLIAQKSEGCMRDALSILDKIVSFTNGEVTYENTIEHLNILDADYYFKLIHCMLEQDLAGAMLLYDDIDKKGIDLAQVQGSGDNGRITKSDIDHFKPTQPSAQPQQKAAVGQAIVSGQEGYTDHDVSQMRKVIAKRLGESKFGAPHFYLTMEINMDNAMQARTQMNEVSEVKISFNDMIVKATSMALRKHPAVNSSWMGDVIRQYQHIHIGVAVAIEDGLIVPVIRFADQKTLSQIAAESKELSGKARNKKLQPNEFTGNTFTISNLGMMDIEEFTAIINPPDSAIMAVGRIKEVVVRKGEGFGVSNVMKITLSCDHRSVDGAVGASFLQTFKKYMENPVTMLV